MTVLQPTEPKPKLESWTLWANAIAIALATAFTTIVPLLPSKAGWLIDVLAIANIILRFKTNRPIA